MPLIPLIRHWSDHIAISLTQTELPYLEREKVTPPNMFVWITLGVLLGVVLCILISLVVLRLRMRAQYHPASLPEGRENGTSLRRADRERLVFAYIPAQAPAIVRMQRLAKKSGISTQELDSVAPVSGYTCEATGTSDPQANMSGDHVCAVCLEDMVPGSKTRRLPCGHWFDADCIDVWATKANRCPVCNTKIIDEGELERRRLRTFEAADHSIRQRQRRTRGESGAFELAIVDEHNILASVSNVPPNRTSSTVVGESA